ncbi:Uncharacterized protein GBIM_02007, partial [Gryllus bimaculatus]
GHERLPLVASSAAALAAAGATAAPGLAHPPATRAAATVPAPAAAAAGPSSAASAAGSAMAGMTELFLKAFVARVADDFKQKELLPLKLLFFVHASTVFVLYPYLTIHMRELGINVKETAIMSAVTPVMAIVMPPLAGMILAWQRFSAAGGAVALARCSWCRRGASRWRFRERARRWASWAAAPRGRRRRRWRGRRSLELALRRADVDAGRLCPWQRRSHRARARRRAEACGPAGSYTFETNPFPYTKLTVLATLNYVFGKTSSICTDHSEDIAKFLLEMMNSLPSNLVPLPALFRGRSTTVYPTSLNHNFPSDFHAFHFSFNFVLFFLLSSLQHLPFHFRSLVLDFTFTPIFHFFFSSAVRALLTSGSPLIISSFAFSSCFFFFAPLFSASETTLFSSFSRSFSTPPRAAFLSARACPLQRACACACVRQGEAHFRTAARALAGGRLLFLPAEGLVRVRCGGGAGCALGSSAGWPPAGRPAAAPPAAGDFCASQPLGRASPLARPGNT